MKCFRTPLAIAFALISFSAVAADYPAPKEADWVARDFKFHTGEVMPEVRLHYTTVGEPTGQPVLVLHGSGGSAKNMLTADFAGQLFGSGQPLDATKYYIIIPDGVGHGKSTKPSDGLKAKFPQYDYADMVDAQYRLLTEGLGIRHVRLIIGNSMGGMHVWLWGEKYPAYMDALVPMASQPTTKQPRYLKLASVFFGIATAGGTLNYQKLAPTSEKADKLVEARLAPPMNADANDFIWAWASSADYDAAPGLERIEASVLAINSADDERNPPESGLEEAALKRVKNGKLYLIPASDETRGHLTTGMAKFYSRQLRQLLQTAPQRQM